MLENVRILVYDQKLSSIADLLPLLEEVAKSGQAFPVIAEDVDCEALATLLVNTMRGVIKTCAVKAPGFGDRRRAGMQDIAVLTAARVFTAELGVSLQKATLADLGLARRVEVDKEHTTIIGGAGTAQGIQERVASIRKARDAASSSYDREQLDSRLSRLAAGVALIKVGAATETERKERKMRVEDALHATRAVVEEGIVPGGGVALLRAHKVLQALATDGLDEASGVKIVARALEEPLRRIVINAADEPSVVVHRVDESAERAFGYNAESGKYGDLIAMGVMDPAKVTRLALQNAGSIAALVLTTECMIADAPKPSNPHGSGSASAMEM